MELQEAVEIVRRLAHGLHPATGESLPDDCLYQHPQTVLALQHAVDALDHQDRRRRARTSITPNSGKPWTDEEDMRLSEELKRGGSLHEIAAAHCRGAGSIIARIMLLRQAVVTQQRRKMA
jgi:hypothetical protein